MRCPHCGCDNDKVLESRTLANGQAIRRRRECNDCGYRFTSYERTEDKPFMVVKKDGRREPFDRYKAERGIVRALEKRPVSGMQVENLLNEIEDETAILSRGSGEISATVIGDIILKRLAELDRVACIRFASVYRHFDTPEEFIREINRLQGGP
ncbi:MAG: transcriptional regulator NrdR [Treponema sp.]|nr:transcriptional regulator NrdR [Treponema sp.]